MTLTINETAMTSDQTAHTPDAGRDLHQDTGLWTPHPGPGRRASPDRT